MKVEYLIVGAGLTGAVIARQLADAGKSVAIIERRCRIGGNCADAYHPSGIRYHLYGPHYFRTSSKEIWDFVRQFAEFYPFRAEVKTFVNGKFENWPLAGSLVRAIAPTFTVREATSRPANLEEAALAIMPRVVYELFVKEYNEKQWGLGARELSPELCRRFAIHWDDNPLLKPTHKYQGLPMNGYLSMIEGMLAGIPVVTNVDFLRSRDLVKWTRRLIFTGPIDEYFGFCLGKLEYRAQKRHLSYHADVQEFLLPAVQVNFPLHSQGAKIRQIEWKRLMPHEFASRICGSLITEEIPYSPVDPEEYEYPAQDFKNKELYSRYQDLAKQENMTLFCGRLGEYRYYDMDMAIGRALLLAKKVLQGE